MNYKNILVTGGAGFVGSALLSHLAKMKKYKLYSLDNYSSGTSKNHIDGVTYIGDKTSNIGDYMWIKPDIVFHFGEYSRVHTSLKDESIVHDYNILGTKAVIDYCVATGARMIYSASSTKFGDKGENINKTPYAFYKSLNVQMIKNFHRWYDLDYTIIYFYNVYGPGQIEEGKYSTAIGIFERQHRSGQPLTVCQPGDQKRDFTHIEDIISGICLIMEKGCKSSYSLGTGKSYSILEIAKMFGDNIKMIPQRPGDRQDSLIDLNSMVDLGWKAKINIKDYIRSLK